ncbi:MAG: hypothetical protein RLZZ244_2606 [Verrucomicrobiota bacterium]|jgi:outer membrane lipoprotein SlyB
MKSQIAVLLVASACALTTGCVVQEGPGVATYSRESRGQAMQVMQVEIIGLQPVKLKDDSSLLGAGAGALAGGIAGSMIGKGKASMLSAVGGAVAGGLLGNEVGKGATSARGVEIMVRTASGQTWSVVQEDRGERFMIGERVRMLISGDGTRRITR